MPRVALALLVVLLLVPGCKGQKDAAKDRGSNLVLDNIEKPIAQAHQVAGQVEDTSPVLLDASTNTYHSTNCRNIDAAALEPVTAGQAKARGAKPDPVCLPKAQ